MSAVLWYTYADGVRLGPMSWDEVRAAARDGSLKPDHYVWTAGYGAEWRKASTLETLFPPPNADAKPPAPEPPPAPGERDAAPGGTAAGAEEPPPRSAAETLRVHLRAERSPFEPPPDAPDGGARRPMHCLAALGTAWYNMRLVLFVPFAFRRWLLFSVAAFLLLIGAQHELFVAPAAIGASAAAPAAEGASSEPAAGSKLLELVARWQDGSAAAEATEDPDALWNDFGEALRSDCVALRDWARRAFDSPGPVAFFALLLLAYAALRSWFLSRAWTLLLGHVYRRDDPAFLAWADTARPSRPILLGSFLLRLVLLPIWALAIARAVSVFAALPGGEAPSRELVSATFSWLALLWIADHAAMAILRDCVAPRALLLRASLHGALAALARDAGWWLLRYFGALLVFLLAYGVALSALSRLVGRLAATLGLPMLATFLLAALVMPLQLWRTLWSLDMLFRLHPELRAALPPRRAEEILRKLQGGGAAR